MITDSEHVFLSVGRVLNATRSRDDGAIVLREELASFNRCWYRYAFKLPIELRWVATCGCLLSWFLVEQLIGDTLTSDEGKNALRDLDMRFWQRDHSSMSYCDYLQDSQEDKSLEHNRSLHSRSSGSTKKGPQYSLTPLELRACCKYPIESYSTR